MNRRPPTQSQWDISRPPRGGWLSTSLRFPVDEQSYESLDPAILRETSEGLAIVIRDGLLRWDNALRWLAHYAATGSVEAREELNRYAREVGLQIVTMARVAETFDDAWGSAPPELDARPALPLAHALGESYVLFLMADSPKLAERLPVVTMERTQQLLTPSVRSWMSHYVDEVPEFRPPG